MTINSYLFWIIIGSGLVTWLPRIIPFLFVKNIQLPKVILKWLTFVPVCILSALVFTNLFEQGDSRAVTFNLPYVFAFIPTVLIAVWTKSLFLTVALGVVSMAVIRFIF
ncbi:MAG TPA: AzlD domain-containing protein [Cerasibacillus sp.]|uniref:AzlD domain-containing protein n=1 Tax=Cerasibacillus sp. TaxID=2498711 RepID=UPI002F42B241